MFIHLELQTGGSSGIACEVGVIKMIVRGLPEDLVASYTRDGAWAKLEALYIVSVSSDGFYNATRNIKIRYGTDEAVREVEKDLNRLCGERGIYSKTDDTDEEVREILAIACENAFPEMLARRVIESMETLTRPTKRFVFLLYKEGGILEGKLSSVDEVIFNYFRPAYEILFGKLEENPNEVHDKIARELVRAGLIYDCRWCSNKHTYYSFIVPPFARKAWSNFPRILNIPIIQIHEVW